MLVRCVQYRTLLSNFCKSQYFFLNSSPVFKFIFKVSLQKFLKCLHHQFQCALQFATIEDCQQGVVHKKLVWKLGLQLLEFCFVKKHLRNIQRSNDQNIKRYWAYLVKQVSYIEKCVYYIYNVVYSMFVSLFQAFQPSSYYTIFEISQIVKAESKIAGRIIYNLCRSKVKLIDFVAS